MTQAARQTPYSIRVDSLTNYNHTYTEGDDLIVDPPFNSKSNYAAPIGPPAADAQFKDTWFLSVSDIAWLDLIESKRPKGNRVNGNREQEYLISKLEGKQVSYV